MANDRNRMMDDKGGSSQREGGMGDDRMRGGGPAPREGDSPERTDRDRESGNRDDVRGIADEGDEEFEDAEETDEEEEEEDRDEGSF